MAIRFILTIRQQTPQPIPIISTFLTRSFGLGAFLRICQPWSGGKVFKVEGKADLGENIVGDLATSYNYFGDRGGVKRFSSVQPMLEGETDVQFDFGVGVDQAPVSGIAVSTTTFASNTAAWDIASWDNFFWADAVGSGITKRRKAVNKFGFSAALRIKVATDSQAISFISAHYTFAPGGPY